MRKITAFGIVVIIFAVSIALLTMYHQSFAQKAPRVILLGESRDFSPEIMSKMPTGYSQDIRGLDSIDFDITGDPDDPVALFSINPENPNIDNQMEFAKRAGKEEIYFFVMKPIENPMFFKVPFSDLNIGLGNLFPIESITSFSFVEESYASVGPPHNCHPSIPAGGCQVTTLPDDDPGDGIQAKITLCIQFPACFRTYFVPLQVHININVANYANPNNQQMSFVNCMRSHNSGTNFMRNPANLTIHWWLNANAMAPSCNNEIACACANGTHPAPIPRISRNRTIHVDQACDVNNWGALRHELAHTYGYDHCEMDLALDKVTDCINGHGKSPTGPTCTACAPCKVCNDNGQNVFTRPCQAPYMPLHDHRVLP